MVPRLLLVLLLAVPILTWRIGRLGFSDTEGMYAEPAREMVVTGDWITPRMNGEPFLTKPPLMYWLSAALFEVAGPTEYARLWPALAALASVAVTGALGAELFGEPAGILAALVLLTSLGFLVEARLLRTDMVLVLVVTLSLYCYLRLRRGAGRTAAVAFWATIGVGLLDKGFLALLLPGGVIAATEIADRDRRRLSLRAFHVPLGLAIVAALVLPWYAPAVHRNPGFLWDSLVNQHLLFFFDRKLPRDNVDPDSLVFFWGMFLAQSLPWSLLLPAALVHTAYAVRARPALRLPVGWLAVVLGFFSLSLSRLGHYSLPALPAVALVMGVFLADAAAERVQVGRAWFVVPPAAVALLGLVCLVHNPWSFVTRFDPMLSGYRLAPLARPAAATLALGFGAVALLLSTRRAWAAVVTAAVTATVMFGFVQVSQEHLEPLFSWRPFARTIRESIPSGTPIFFRATDEYQLCGGLDYYTGRYAEILAPPGWVPPTFLAGRTDRLLTPRSELERAWRGGQAVFVSDDLPILDHTPIVPGSYSVVSHVGPRVLLRSAVSPIDPREDGGIGKKGHTSDVSLR
jgi:4-amino-4-deoxy-L-arabinose transferase-like glycosyltransferase